MCGRYTLTATPDEVRRVFGYLDLPNFPPRYNIAPTQPIPIVTRFEGQRRFMLVRWGLIPSWTKDPAAMALLINARAETAAEKPSFRAAWRHRRCLMPATGFYEWQKQPGGRKQPYWIRPRQGGVIGLAGLWETYSSADGSEIDTAAILTVAANAAIGAIHDRMPAVVAPENFEAWLDTVGTDARAAAALIRPVDDDFFEAVPISERVNAAAHDDASILMPLAEPWSGAPAAPTASKPDPDGGDAGKRPGIGARAKAARGRRSSGGSGGGQMDLL